MSYDIFCQSVQGASHIKNDMPCEDSGKIHVTDFCKIFVLGDGHGDSNCPRSKIGSQYICDITVQSLEKFAFDIESLGWEEKLFNKAEMQPLMNQLITSIFGKWSCAVNDEFIQNPLTDKESEAANEYIERYRKGERIEHIYGTTLIAGLLTKDYLLLLQQGDGRCVVFNADGSTSQPIPWDDRCFANVTTSVCDTDAIQSCRYHITDLTQNPVIACVAGSDGVEDSFSSMDKMHVYYRNLLEYACENGTKELESYLEENLPEFSANGSGDDTTICGIIDIEAFKSKLDKMVQENEMINVKDEISRAQERIDSMSNKLSFLEKKYNDAVADYSAIESKYSSLETEYKSIEKDLFDLAESEKETITIDADSGYVETVSALTAKKINKHLSSHSSKLLSQALEELEEKMNSLRDDLERTKAKKEICETEYLPYREKYDGYVKAKEDALKRIEELNAQQGC